MEAKLQLMSTVLLLKLDMIWDLNIQPTSLDFQSTDLTPSQFK
jgi:hypothetical protein